MTPEMIVKKTRNKMEENQKKTMKTPVSPKITLRNPKMRPKILHQQTKKVKGNMPVMYQGMGGVNVC